MEEYDILILKIFITYYFMIYLFINFFIKKIVNIFEFIIIIIFIISTFFIEYMRKLNFIDSIIIIKNPPSIFNFYNSKKKLNKNSYDIE